ncbi:MAG: glutaredoxin family protein [Thioalkalispiraceae bacterium]|jgi:glutaredoxin
MKYFLITLSLLVFSTSSYSEIYKWIDDKGDVHFGDRKPASYEPERLKLKVNTYTSVSYGTATVAHGQDVVMYSTSWCGYCKKARAYFEQNNIACADYDIENNPVARQEYQAMGATGVPVIIVGDKRMNGFSVKGFERIYN